MGEEALNGMRLYVVDRVEKGSSCRCAVLQLSCGACSGWSEAEVARCGQPFDLVRWACCLQPLRRMTPEQAMRAVQERGSGWGEPRRRLVLGALLELRERLTRPERPKELPVWTGEGRLGAAERDERAMLERAASYYEIL
ncbi:hypothetical protein B8V81_1752 [Paenibacillus pasadenensis]|uniref:Uncharacterized protein n=1 Tax=Paenibacillus pasadenensis TaxID=217090 RepID=A0A2N5NB28_9BACL|nr:hypothetical protein [Paenibacillus pasadenensis]PLT47528.1 hypothetical protein B8V81_1752 [Paenibacillus pasadenensis]